MGAMSLWHWLVVAALVLVLFGGGGKISSLMGDLAKGITNFKKGIAEADPAKPEQVHAVADATAPSQPATQPKA